MKKHIVLNGQSLFDIAVIAYGDVSGVAWLLADNRALNGPTDRLQIGQVLTIRDDTLNLRARVYLADYAPIATIAAQDVPQGIGFWRLDEYLIS
jgi:hypothetical protein